MLVQSQKIHRRYTWPITYSYAFLLTLYLTFTLGPVVTYDGQQYIASAKAIGSGKIAEHYFLARPPGYPLFLVFCHLVSAGNFRFVIMLQAFLTLISIIYLIKGISNLYHIRRNYQLFINFLLLSQIMVLGYSSAILQQSLFIVYANFLGGFLIRLRVRKQRQIDFLKISIMVLIGSLISPTLDEISYLSLFVFAFLSWKQESKHSKNQITFLVKTVFLLFVVVLPSLTFEISWGNFITQQSKTAPTYNIASSPGIKNIIEIPGYFLQNPQKAIDEVTFAYASQSGLIPSSGWQGTYKNPGSVLFENRVQSELNYNSSRQCGLVDQVNNAPWVLYGQGYFSIGCAPFGGLNSIFTLGQALAYFTKFLWISLFGLIVITLSLANLPRVRSVLGPITIIFFPSLATSYTYLAMGAQADRYAIEAVTPMLLGFLVLAGVINNRINWYEPENQAN